MPSSKLLVDSSFLYTLFGDEDEKHEEAVVIADIYRGQFVIPYVVLTEVAYLCNREGGIPAVLKFLDDLAAMQPHFEVLLTTDFLRVRAIMAFYKDSKLDFVDCCIMALSERLNINQVCTFDHRDFNIFRPQHVSHLEILP